MTARRRYAISAGAWALLKPHLPGSEGHVGRPATDNRPFIDAVFGYCAQVRRGRSWELEAGASPLLSLVR